MNYIHVGKDVMLKKSDIVGIFDMEELSPSDKFLKKSKDICVDVRDDIPKSFIVTTDNVFITQMSAAVLLKRFESSTLE